MLSDMNFPIKKIIFLLLLFPLLLPGGEYFQKYREKAAGLTVYSEEDFSLGAELIAEMKKMGLKRKPFFAKPRFIMEVVSWRIGRLYETSNFWYDRQLFTDRKLWVPSDSPFQEPSVARGLGLMEKYRAGCTFFAGASYNRNARMFYQAAEKFPEMIVVPGLRVIARVKPEKDLFRQVAENPHSLKVAGKGVFFTYECDHLSPEELEKYLGELKKCADGYDFTIIPEMSGHYMKFGWKHGKLEWPTVLYQKTGKISAIQLLHCFDLLTRYCRISGGLDIPSYIGRRDQTLDVKVYDDLLLPLFSAVCAQDEFNGRKVLMLQVMHCYTSYHGSQSLQADGTETIRKYLELCEKYKIDIPLGFEWDELNEGTNLEPTVARPMALQKIIRYWMDKMHGIRSPEYRRDSWFPDLIVSQRRQINLGTEFKIELLNVPDGGEKEKYQVIIELLDHAGNIVHESEKFEFDRSRLMAHSVTLDSEKFSAARLIRPELKIIRNGEMREFSGGLPFTVVRPAVCNDQTWFNTPLDNVLIPEKAVIKAERAKDIFPGVVQFYADVKASFPEKIVSAEIVQNSNSIFAFDAQNEYLQHDPLRALFRVNYRYLNNPPMLMINTVLSGRNMPSVISFADGENSGVSAKKIHGFPGEKKFTADVWVKSQLFSVLTSEVPDAEIIVSGKRLSGVLNGKTFTHRFPLKDIGKYGIVSHVFADGLVVSVERLYRPTRLPMALDNFDVDFREKVVCDNPDSVCALRVVSRNGKVWWTPVFLPEYKKSPGRSCTLNSWSDRRGMISFSVPSERVKEIEYKFTPLYGNILTSDSGRDFWAHIGSYLSLSTGFEGTLGSRFTVPGCHISTRKANLLNTPSPAWIKLPEGGYALSFDGKSGNFVAFPNSFISQRSGFVMEFEIKPMELAREQILFRQYGPSYQTGFGLVSRPQGLQITFRRRTGNAADPGELSFDTGVKLAENVWQKVIFSYDGKVVSISANGKTAAFHCSGIPLWMSVSSFGGDGSLGENKLPRFFCGELKSMKITHYKGENQL